MNYINIDPGHFFLPEDGFFLGALLVFGEVDSKWQQIC